MGQNPVMPDYAEKHLAYCWIERGDAMLFLRRQADSFLGGRWELPGGTVEPAEAPEATAVREAAEETGLTVRVVGERSRDEWPDIGGRPLRIHARIYATIEEDAAEVVLDPAEHDAFAWLTPAEAAARLDLVDHIRRALPAPLEEPAHRSA